MAARSSVSPTASTAESGMTSIAVGTRGAPIMTVALALADGSATLVARTVTRGSAGAVAGAR